MNTRISHHFILLSFFVFCFSAATSLYGQSLGGKAGAALRFGFGAHSLGMGNAVAAVVHENVIAYENPALVPYQPNRSIIASAGFLSLDRSLNSLSYTQSLKPAAGLALGVVNAGVSEIQGRDRDGEPTSVYSTSENVFFLSFGLKVARELSVGVTAKILYHSLYDGIASTTAGFDIGALYAFDENLLVAVILQDINSKYQWETSTLYGRNGNITVDRFPLRRKIAVSYNWAEPRVTTAAEAEWIGNTFIARFGTNVSLTESFQIIGGLDHVSFAREFDSRPSVGFSFQPGLKSFNPTLYYTYVVEPYGPSAIHFVAISVEI